MMRLPPALSLDIRATTARSRRSARSKDRRQYMNAILPLSADDMDMLATYQAEVLAVYSPLFQNESTRLTGTARLVSRFTDAMSAVVARGRSQFHAVDEAHNELCAASALLENARLTSVAYEPSLQGTDQTIDFVVVGGAGTRSFVDVKTIRPSLTDRWDQFERVRAAGQIPPNIEVVLSRDWLGGELWHMMFASRGRMLEYTLEFEAKIRAANLEGTPAIMMFCGEGSYWHDDELEDFIHFYRTGQHRPDDPFAEMEAWYVAQRNIAFDRTITGYATMRRHQFDIRYTRLNWDV